MLLYTLKSEVKESINYEINLKKTIGLVPTMGALHKGHISLLKHAITACDVVWVTIFVNPTQFNNVNDFKTYPRNLDKDIKLLKRLKVDFLYLPTITQIYNNKERKVCLLYTSDAADE